MCVVMSRTYGEHVESNWRKREVKYYLPAARLRPVHSTWIAVGQQSPEPGYQAPSSLEFDRGARESIADRLIVATQMPGEERFGNGRE